MAEIPEEVRAEIKDAAVYAYEAGFAAGVQVGREAAGRAVEIGPESASKGLYAALARGDNQEGTSNGRS